ncbi:MAG: transglutaminase [Spirochaetales bacterium]|jgi:transglutaminase-like putative cysteine protease|nr:transglutaminase [Spirochaetales bacterium]
MKFLQRVIHHKATLPVLIFAAFIGVLFLSLSRSEKPPRLQSISPEIGTPGGVLLIKGRHFGSERLGSSVSISGTRPTSTSYLEWSDSQISVQIPEDAGTGLVNVTTRLGTSGGILFTNKNRIPVVISESIKPGVPYIEDISPSAGAIGTVITITGLNFGLSKGDGQVMFTPLAVSVDLGLDQEIGTHLLPASEIDFDYESWTDQEIRVRVPDGATSGNIRIETDRGTSNTAYFEVANMPGTKILGERRGYQILYSIQISGVKAAPGGSIDIWVPGPLADLEQRDIEHVKIPDPLWDNYFGLSRYQISDPLPNTVYRINQTFWFDRYEVETKISTAKVGRTYDTNSKLYRVFTSPSDQIPSEDESILSAARSAVGREQNPYLQARGIYLYLLKQLVYSAKPEGKTILENFVAASADSYGFTMLFTAMARAAAIPARPVAGFIIYGERNAKIHYWAEFYIPDFGWVPVDLALGDGARFDVYPEIEEPQEYFFGNVDSHHIAFTKGVVEVKSLLPGAKIIQYDKIFSLQTIHEEASSSVQSYLSSWSDLQVIDIW